MKKLTSAEVKNLDAQNVMQTYARFDVAIDRGEGATLFSPEGKEYIDFTSGIGVNSLGYGNKKWAEAIFDQVMKLQHISNLYYTEPYARLASILTERAGLKNVFFSNSGAEANEGMIKLARKYSFQKYGKNRNTIVTLEQSFHGRTITTLAATGQSSFHNYFFPFTEGFKFVPAGCVKSLEQGLTDDVCAVMIEIIQGEGGVIPLNDEYILALEKLCRERDILLLIDEIQTGIGRTGEFFAFKSKGVQPDVISFAKGIAGGLPLGGFIAGERCSETLSVGDHAATFGGNPVSAAAALEVLNQITPELLDDVKEKGKYINKTVSAWNLPLIKEPRGVGLMIGIPVIDSADIKPKDIAIACAEQGLLILTAGTDALRMLPPLTITYDEISKGLKILKTVLEEISK